MLVLGVLMNIRGSITILLSSATQLAAFRGPCASLMAFTRARPPLPARREAVRDARNLFELEAIGYRYPGADRTALQDAEGVILRGGSTCIVGPNGAGKSTLVKLLSGLYQPTAGQLREAPDAPLAVMNQDFSRFPLTVRENLAGADEELSAQDDELVAELQRVGLGALQEARSTDVFRFRTRPLTLAAVLRGSSRETIDRGVLGGLDSYLYIDADGNGTDLSGGQWQRLAIARTVLRARRSGAALFDEPTSALDPYAESDLLDHIEQEMRGGTLVLVTHRLSHAARADRILVVQDGRITAAGSPREVYRDSAWYREAFDLQAAGYRTASPIEDVDPSGA